MCAQVRRLLNLACVSTLLLITPRSLESCVVYVFAQRCRLFHIIFLCVICPQLKPMRFFYRIFTPLKVQPIKIINTSSSNGSKQLQIVPVRSTSNNTTNTVDLEAEKSKEQFVAQLKLQSKHKNGKAVMGSTAENCVFEYAEADEEIKRFAESRDREWARMRHEDVVEPQNSNLPSSVVVPSITPQISNDGVMIEGGGSSHHVKKRKKSKHSKGEAKKPKIHAEITSEVVLQ